MPTPKKPTLNLHLEADRLEQDADSEGYGVPPGKIVQPADPTQPQQMRAKKARPVLYLRVTPGLMTRIDRAMNQRGRSVRNNFITDIIDEWLRERSF